MIPIQFFLLSTGSFGQCFGVGCGVLKVDNSRLAPLLSIHYSIEIVDKFFINESIGYWQKPYKEAEGARSKECVFSCLFVDETAIFKLTKWNIQRILWISLGAGPGLGIYLLKNCVKDISEVGGWVTTDYYTLTKNTMGFHIATMVGANFRKLSISVVAKYGIILVDGDTKNLFYTLGDIQESSYSMLIGVNRGIK
ncbi:MAG: hypothetical protein QMD71_07990 [bacterium]|nr:hypothetical protein [bacterium]